MLEKLALLIGREPPFSLAFLLHLLTTIARLETRQSRVTSRVSAPAPGGHHHYSCNAKQKEEKKKKKKFAHTEQSTKYKSKHKNCWKNHHGAMALCPTSREFFLLWCLLSTAFSIPTPTPTSTSWQIEEQQRFTTSPSKRSLVSMVATTTTKFPVAMNSKVKLTTTTEGTTTLMATTTTTQRTFSLNQPLYRLNSMNGQACILLQVDALISVQYRTKLGEDQVANIYVPDDATVTGNCDGENSVTMSLKWKAFVLSWSFAKTLGGERWYVDKIELTYNSSDRHFEHIEQPNKTVRLSTGQKHSPMLFPTPVGKSYSCDEEVNITLTDGKNHATVLLRDMKLQPFKFKSNDFASEFSCKLLNAQAGRDETAPVAVGSTLAAAVLLTITGYAGYRYFKVKKVKYDTME